jgi:hypothetical protein
MVQNLDVYTMASFTETQHILIHLQKQSQKQSSSKTFYKLQKQPKKPRKEPDEEKWLQMGRI